MKSSLTPEHMDIREGSWTPASSAAKKFTRKSSACRWGVRAGESDIVAIDSRDMTGGLQGHFGWNFER